MTSSRQNDYAYSRLAMNENGKNDASLPVANEIIEVDACNVRVEPGLDELVPIAVSNSPMSFEDTRNRIRPGLGDLVPMEVPNEVPTAPESSDRIQPRLDGLIPIEAPNQVSATRANQTVATRRICSPQIYDITGNELLHLLKEDRKRKTLNMGVLGGGIGLLFVGPIAAIICGSTFAIFTKQDLRQREEIVRFRLSGRLNEPISRVTAETSEVLRTAVVQQNRRSCTITGNEILQRQQEKRKRATVTMGIVGGAVGLILLGPVGALVVGTGNALATKYCLMRREKATRRQLAGKLDQPHRVHRNQIGYI